MREYNNEIPKYRKNKHSTKSKTKNRADHKHEYEKVLVEGMANCYIWCNRCKVCGRLESINWAAAHDGVRKERESWRYGSSADYYSAEELHEMYPEARIFNDARDENGNRLYGRFGEVELFV